MGQITSLFVHKVIAQVDDSLDKRAYLTKVGLDPDAPVDPKIMVADTDYYAFFSELAMADPNGVDLPLRTGASMRSDDYGAFGLAWKSAPNLRGSCERAERYARVLTSVSTYQARESAQGYCFHLHRDGDRADPGLRLSNEATIASMAAICQEVSTSVFQPLAVYFKHSGGESSAVHERHFGCAVHFGQEMDALLISHDTMHAPNKVGDSGIVKFFDTHLEQELSQLTDSQSLEQRVRREISQALSEGVPTVSSIAAHFDMSGRTLQRRLADSGHSFVSLVDASRRELAERLLRETTYPLAEIAFLTGFSEQSAFNRAFKRWAGQTPRSFRLRA